jgi:CRP/FNR family transcriptional regulator
LRFGKDFPDINTKFVLGTFPDSTKGTGKMDDFYETRNCVNCSKRSRCFQKLIPEELEFINQNKTHLFFKKGETICKQGAFSSYLMYFSDGLGKLYLEAPGHGAINLKIITNSDFLGLSSVYGENTFQFSAVALADSVVCLIEKDGFRRLLENNGNFASEIIRWHCESEKNLINKIKSLGHKQMHGRMADALLYLCGLSWNDGSVLSTLSRKDIAGFAGISTESAVRILSEFRNEGIIDEKQKQFTILDEKRLKDISLRG